MQIRLHQSQFKFYYTRHFNSLHPENAFNFTFISSSCEKSRHSNSASLFSYKISLTMTVLKTREREREYYFQFVSIVMMGCHQHLIKLSWFKRSESEKWSFNSFRKLNLVLKDQPADVDVTGNVSMPANWRSKVDGSENSLI